MTFDPGQHGLATRHDPKHDPLVWLGTPKSDAGGEQWSPPYSLNLRQLVVADFPVGHLYAWKFQSIPQSQARLEQVKAYKRPCCVESLKSGTAYMRELWPYLVAEAVSRPSLHLEEAP